MASTRDDIADSRYDQEWDYQVGRDQVADQRYEDETEYSRALERAQTLAAAGDFSGYLDLGYSADEVANLKAGLYQGAGSVPDLLRRRFLRRLFRRWQQLRQLR